MKSSKGMIEEIVVCKNDKTLIYFLLAGIVALIITGGLFLILLKNKQVIIRTLQKENERILRQKNEIASAAKKAEKAIQSKIAFFTNVSHEFRTSLTLIIGPVEDILNNRKISSWLKDDVALVKRNAIRLLRLVNQLKEFRKVESKEIKLNATENDIVAFLKVITTSFSHLAQKRKVDFEFKTEVREMNVFFDVDKLDKVMFNLLSNAFKFTKENGRVTVIVGVSEDKSNAIIEVEDTGVGMTKEQADHVFEWFYSANNSNYCTGIGLALAKEFIDLHQGTIECVSEKWRGTKFIISLPLGSEHLSSKEPTMQQGFTKDEKGMRVPLGFNEQNIFSKETKAETELFPDDILVEDGNAEFDEIHEEYYTELEDDKVREYSILLIEGSKELRQYIKKNLNEEFDVFEAFNGSDGLSKGFAFIPDLIICDVALPDMSGITVVKKFKRDIRTSHIPIVLLTAGSFDEQEMEGIISGADICVPKPFYFKYLYHTIKGLIRTRKMLKDHYNPELPVEAKDVNPGRLDKAFINKFVAIVEQNFSNAEFSANDVIESLGMSRVQAYRKVKSLLGYTINDYITKVRLKKAKQLLLESNMNIAEIAFEVGFSSPAYFSTIFKNHFKMSPSDFRSSKPMN